MTELMIPFDDKSAPLYEQIYRFIKDEIVSGRIPARTKLPSTRQLAVNLSVSRATVQLAYDQLTAEGYLESEPCRGYFSADVGVLLQMHQTGTGSEAANPGFQVAEETPFVDFSPRGIDLEHFPYNTWRKLSREILTDDHKNLFTSGDPRGELSLRQAICQYLKSARLVDCRPGQMIIGAGSEYLLMLLNQILGGSAIAMENPTYKQAYRVFRRLGHPVVPVPMDKNGMQTEALRATGAEMAYIMPSHQYPTGVVMPIKRRRELLAWAAESAERYIIEDDYDSEFRYRGKPIPALWGSGHPGKVIYLGTFSKSVAPAIRVSYMVLPDPLLEQYNRDCSFYASTVSRVDQEILTRFLSEGYFERHLNRMRGIYRAKHDVLMNALEPLREHFSVQGDMAGLHILLKARDGQSEGQMIRQAEAAGIRVYGLSSYFIKEMEQPEEMSQTVILGYANLTEDEIRRGVDVLVRAWTS